MDLYSYTIVGSVMNEQMTENSVINALTMALSRRKITTGLLLHSDHGSQYAAKAYQDVN
jgi:putative transposase